LNKKCRKDKEEIIILAILISDNTCFSTDAHAQKIGYFERNGREASWFHG